MLLILIYGRVSDTVSNILNVILASNIEYITIGLAIARGIGAGMMHGLCQAAVAYGLSYITQYRKLSYTGTNIFMRSDRISLDL